MEQNEKWLNWAVELQSLAQAGLFYTKDPFVRSATPAYGKSRRRCSAPKPACL